MTFPVQNQYFPLRTSRVRKSNNRRIRFLILSNNFHPNGHVRARAKFPLLKLLEEKDANW